MIYVLNTDHNYDRILHATAVNKMISIIAAYKSHVVKDDIEAYREAHFDSITPKDEEMRRMLIDDPCTKQSVYTVQLFIYLTAAVYLISY